MSTYDNRGGGPLSPNILGSAPSDLEEEVLDTLERLDEARARAKKVLEDVFLRLMRHRYPIGAVVDIDRVTVYSEVSGAIQAKITRYFKPDISIEAPEVSELSIEGVALRKDGGETRNFVYFREPVLGRDYWTSAAKRAPRDQLIKLIQEMQAQAVEQPALGPTL